MLKKTKISSLAKSTVVYDDCFIGTSEKCDSSRIVSRLDALLELARGKRVLHIGCCDHIGLIDKKIRNKTWLHGLLCECAVSCCGIDIEVEAVDYVRMRGYKDVYVCDLLKEFPQELADREFDVVILGEMVEHLDSPIHFLKMLRSYLRCAYKLVITVPNAFFLENFINVLGHFERINSDHRAWYTAYTITKVLSLGGYDVSSFEYVFRGDPVGYAGKSTILRTLYGYPEYRDVLLVQAYPKDCDKEDGDKDKENVCVSELSDEGALIESRNRLSALLSRLCDKVAADRDRAYRDLAAAWKARDEVAADRDRVCRDLAAAWKAHDEVVADRDRVCSDLAAAWKAHDEVAADRDGLKMKLKLSHLQEEALEKVVKELRSGFSYRVARFCQSIFEKR